MDFWLSESLKVIILGIVEGVTEFLPISSTGHLIIATSLLDLNDNYDGTFELFIQIGAVVAVIAFYWKDLLYQLQNFRSDKSVQRLWLNILIALVPVLAIGFLISPYRRDLMSPIVIAIALIAGGVVFLVIERMNLDKKATVRDMNHIRIKQALTIGVIQCFALIPGTSRSGASIIGAMISGISREAATQFSFYLALPTLLSVIIFDLVDSQHSFTAEDLYFLILGAVVSGIVSWFSIRWLLRYVAHHSFVPFGWYRIIVGIVLIALLAAQIL